MHVPHARERLGQILDTCPTAAFYRINAVTRAFFAPGCEPALQKRILEAVTPIAEKYVKSGESLSQVLEDPRIWQEREVAQGSGMLRVLKPQQPQACMGPHK